MVPLFFSLRSMLAKFLSGRRFDLPAAILHKAAVGGVRRWGTMLAMGMNGSKEQLFAEVSSTCTGLINRIALSYEADPSLRRELVQDILLAIWIALSNFRGDSSIKTFAASIAQKRCISHVAKRAREPRQVELSVDLASAAPPPDEVALNNDRKRLLVESIQKLPIPQREMATILGISANAVMLRCQRAKSTLKTIVERRS
jgi:RNA polymerase sigma-70 factor (ECF subfamily)